MSNNHTKDCKLTAKQQSKVICIKGCDGKREVKPRKIIQDDLIDESEEEESSDEDNNLPSVYRG